MLEFASKKSCEWAQRPQDENGSHLDGASIDNITPIVSGVSLLGLGFSHHYIYKSRIYVVPKQYQQILGGDELNQKCTPWKINMEPKNGGLENDFPFQQIFRFHVDFQGCRTNIK